MTETPINNDWLRWNSKLGFATDEMIRQQRSSFALGNANIDDNRFSRSTVTMAVSNRMLLTDAPPVLKTSKESYLREVAGIIQQYDITLELIKSYTKTNARRFLLSPELLVKLQMPLAEIYGTANSFRTVPVRIAMNDFVPIDPGGIPQEVERFCSYVNDSWQELDAFQLAAFVLWRLNWIHPFIDGNGRTARALSYMVLSIKLGAVLPGIPVIPEQLAQNRGAYFDALAIADKSFAKFGRADLAPLISLVAKMLDRQLGSLPALEPSEFERINDLVNRRVRGAQPELLTRIFGRSDFKVRLWSLDGYLVLQLAAEEIIAKTEDMYWREGTPFPRLLSNTSESPAAPIPNGKILKDETLNATRGTALAIDFNSTVTVENPRVFWEKPGELNAGWSLPCLLVIIRLGRTLTLTRAIDSFDLSLTRYMSASHI